MRYTAIDQRVAALAARQFGAFNRQQAFRLGASERFVQRRLADGTWLRPIPAVYTLASSDGTWLRQCKIAELSVSDSAMAIRSAAALRRLTGFRPGSLDLLVPATAHSTHPLATVHRFAGALVTEVDGIRTTTIAQTIFDLAMSGISSLKIERALDDALLERRVAIDDLVERTRFYDGSRRAGLGVVRALIAERQVDGWTPPESELEALLYRVLDRLPSRPSVVRQAPGPWRTVAPGRVDALLSGRRLIIEADGRRWHTRVQDFERDRWRDNEAVAHGFRVQRFTWVHLHDFADETIDLIERTLACAA